MFWCLHIKCVEQLEACMSVFRNATVVLQKRGNSACLLPHPYYIDHVVSCPSNKGITYLLV